MLYHHVQCGAHIGVIASPGSRAEPLPYSSKPNPLAADGNNKARLAVSWLDSVLDRISQAVYFTWSLIGQPSKF